MNGYIELLNSLWLMIKNEPIASTLFIIILFYYALSNIRVTYK